MPAETLSYSYSGNEYSALMLRGYGLSQLKILKRLMSFQNLSQLQRRLEFADGTVIKVTSCHGADTVAIYVPPRKVVPLVVEEEEYVTPVICVSLLDSLTWGPDDIGIPIYDQYLFNPINYRFERCRSASLGVDTGPDQFDISTGHYDGDHAGEHDTNSFYRVMMTSAANRTLDNEVIFVAKHCVGMHGDRDVTLTAYNNVPEEEERETLGNWQAFTFDGEWATPKRVSKMLQADRIFTFTLYYMSVAFDKYMTRTRYQYRNKQFVQISETNLDLLTYCDEFYPGHFCGEETIPAYEYFYSPYFLNPVTSGFEQIYFDDVVNNEYPGTTCTLSAGQGGSITLYQSEPADWDGGDRTCYSCNAHISAFLDGTSVALRNYMANFPVSMYRKIYYDWNRDLSVSFSGCFCGGNDEPWSLDAWMYTVSYWLNREEDCGFRFECTRAKVSGGYWKMDDEHCGVPWGKYCGGGTASESDYFPCPDLGIDVFPLVEGRVMGPSPSCSAGGQRGGEQDVSSIWMVDSDTVTTIEEDVDKDVDYFTSIKCDPASPYDCCKLAAYPYSEHSSLRYSGSVCSLSYGQLVYVLEFRKAYDHTNFLVMLHQYNDWTSDSPAQSTDITDRFLSEFQRQMGYEFDETKWVYSVTYRN